MANEPNYSSNPSKDEPKKEKVRVIPLEYIDEFPGHPFKVLDDESMQKLMNSIEEIGVQSPIVARIKEDQRYEIISGHRRVHACRRLGLKLIPAIVRDLSRDEAIIAMVDANLQREHILPSEKAAAYKMKMDAMKRRAGRPSKNNSAPLEQNFGITTRDVLAQESPDSSEQIRRYIRLNELVPELLEMVDRESIVWRCINRIEHGTRICRDSITVEESRLHQAICKGLCNAAACRDEVLELIKSNLSYAITGNEKILDAYAIQKNIERVNDEMDQAMIGFSTTQGDKNKYLEVINIKNSELAVLREQLALANKQVHSDDFTRFEIEKLEQALTTCDMAQTSFSDSQIRTFVECIRVNKKNTIHIVLKGGFSITEEL